MSRDNLFESLIQAAASRSIPEDELHHMLEAEVRTLSSDARVHDFIRVIAMRHLRERMIAADRDASDAPDDYRAAEPVETRDRA